MSLTYLPYLPQEIDSYDCPVCEGPGFALGTLGYLLHLRCADCGMTFAVNSPDSYEEE